MDKNASTHGLREYDDAAYCRREWFGQARMTCARKGSGPWLSKNALTSQLSGNELFGQIINHLCTKQIVG